MPNLQTHLDEVTTLLNVHAETLKHPTALKNIRDAAMDRLRQIDDELSKIPLQAPPQPSLQPFDPIKAGAAQDPIPVASNTPETNVPDNEPTIVRRTIGEGETHNGA